MEASWGRPLPHILCFSCSLKYLCVCVLRHSSHVWLLATPQTAAQQAPLSMGFSRQEYWSGLPCPLPGESSWPRDQTHVSCLLHWQGFSLPLAPSRKPWSTWITSDAYSWIVLQMWKPPTKWKRLTTTWPGAHNPRSPEVWGLIMWHCPVTTPSNHQKTVHSYHAPHHPVAHLAYKNALLKPTGELGVLSTSCPGLRRLWHFTIKPALFFTESVSVDWLYCKGEQTHVWFSNISTHV